MPLGIERDPEVKPFLEALSQLCREHRLLIHGNRDGIGFWLSPMLESEATGSYAAEESPAEFAWKPKA
jgi:hypothetical protein